MVKKLLIVALLGLAGLALGVAVTALGGPRYNASDEMWLPAHSREPATDLVAMVQGQHPGVRVIPAGSRVIYVSANGSLAGSAISPPSWAGRATHSYAQPWATVCITARPGC